MNNIYIDAGRGVGAINKNIFGHFSEHLGRCVYQGLYVGEDSKIPNVNGMRADVVAALRRINIPVLRWPGGCFADEYHWRDGIGPKNKRRRMVNTHWGYVSEDNSFGTHEFLELCRQLKCEPYINGNLGSGTVSEMSEWVEYLNSDGDSTVVRERVLNGHTAPFGVKYFGVGNESWGCGGNMRPEYYADEYRRYQTYCRNYGENKLYKIACGPSDGDVKWTEALMRIAGNYMDALTMHYYVIPSGNWGEKGRATQFSRERYYETLSRALKMDELISAHLRVMDVYDPEHRVGLIVDEWGCWHDVEPGTNPGFLYQQNTMRDALVAALTLNVFIAHADRVVMANLAQTVNVLQAVVLTEGNDMVLTPTYHVFDLYKAHQSGEALAVQSAGEQAACGLSKVHASASIKDGVMTLTLANASADADADISVELAAFSPRAAHGRILAGATDEYNDFGNRRLAVKKFDGARLDGNRMDVKLPACCVAEFTLS